VLPSANKIDLGNRSYDLALRFKRTYKPYAVRLIKTEEHDWPGTNNPQYFSSDIHMKAPHEDRHDHIWMNIRSDSAARRFISRLLSGFQDG